MFSLLVRSSHGVEAEFTLASATLALDLALRSERAGLVWSAQAHADGAPQPLSLRSLRHLAAAQAATSEERQVLDEIEWQHELQSSFRLN